MLISCLGIGKVLSEYLVETDDHIKVWDFKLQDAVGEGDCEAADELEDKWDSALEAATEQLEPLHYLVTEQDTMSENPYFAVGVTPNGNVAGYVSSLVWT